VYRLTQNNIMRVNALFIKNVHQTILLYYPFNKSSIIIKDRHVHWKVER